jgi:sterol desaturase/sphingolipid hydroxylase (fatty acid hydroxylase superfamily)
MRDLLIAHSYLVILLAFGLLEALSGRFRQPGQDANQTSIDLASLAIVVLSRPLVYAIVFALAFWLAPDSRDAWAGLPVWAWVLLLLIFEDMAQYWWHRFGHTRFGWLWHRAHHSAPYMGVRVTLRNGFLYTFLMPSAWTASLLIFLGAGATAFVYGLVKGLVTVAAHSEIRWDRFLYSHKALSPLAWIVERTISTPATHFSHHALRDDDGIGHYKGNFGNLLFFWDVLFGTALITRHYPPAFGVENDLVYGQEKWTTQLFFPLFGSRRENSEFNAPDRWTRRRAPAPAE